MNPSHKQNNFSAIIAGLIAVFLWSAIPALVKVGTVGQALTFLIMLRFLISSALFLPILPRIFSKIRILPTKLLLLLTLVLAANYYFQGLAMQALPASWYIVIFSLNPLLALVAFGIKLSRRSLIMCLVPILGTYLFIEGGGGWSAPIASVVYIFIGMLTWVAYTVLIQKFQAKLSDIEVTGVTQILSLLGCFIIWVASSSPMTDLSAKDLISVLILGLSTPVAYFAFSYCMRRVPVFGIVSQYLEPVFGIVIGMILFNESITVNQAIGAGLIVWGTSRATK